MSSRGAEWRAIQIFQTYFWGAKFPMEAEILGAMFQTRQWVRVTHS